MKESRANEQDSERTQHDQPQAHKHEAHQSVAKKTPAGAPYDLKEIFDCVETKAVMRALFKEDVPRKVAGIPVLCFLEK